MKNVVLCVSLFLLSICGYSQASREVLQHFLEKMTEGPVELSFNFTYNNEPKKVHDSQTGIILFSGRQFHLQLGDLDVYCDGTSKWVCNETVGEVTIFHADEASEMTDNPLEYIINNEDNFLYRSIKHLVQQGRNVVAIDLVPKSTEALYDMISLQIEEGTFMPVQIIYRLKDGQRYIIDVSMVDAEVAVKPFSFVFPSHLYSNITINDMR
jgi:outer membrane lipoprotein-sorting protein